MDSQQAGINSYRSFVIGQLTQLAINLGEMSLKGGHVLTTHAMETITGQSLN